VSSTRSEIHKKGRIRMASNAKKKTTMAKMNRENAVRERRLRKQAKRDARKQAATGQPGGPSDPPTGHGR
jgi:hypothetical protein